MRNFSHFEDEVKEVAIYVRDQVKKIESIHRISFAINVEGRIDGDLKIEFRVGTDYDSSVGAGHVAAALYEAMRRKGWSNANAPICISYVGATNESV